MRVCLLQKHISVKVLEGFAFRITIIRSVNAAIKFGFQCCVGKTKNKTHGRRCFQKIVENDWVAL